MTTSTKVLIAIIGISVGLRMLAALILNDQIENLPGTADQVSYHTLAVRLLNGYGLSFGENWWPATAANAPTAHWSYLYTAFLTSIYILFGAHVLVARLIQAILVGILHPLIVYLIAKRIFNYQVGIAAAGITAIYAYFVYYSAALMTESFYITWILIGLYLAIHIVDISRSDHQKGSVSKNDQRSINGYLLTLGMALGIAVLLRQLFMIFVPFLLLWVWKFSQINRTKNAIIPGLVVILTILPFTIYNYFRFDNFVLLNTNAGYAFFWGNHPVYGTRFLPILSGELGNYQDLIPSELKGLDEAALDQALLRLGIQFIVDEPGRYIMLSISRIPVYFMFWPSTDSSLVSNISRVASFGLFLPLMIYGVILSLKQPMRHSERSHPLWLLYTFVAIYIIIHLLSWALIRYRLPVDAVMILFAALGFVNLVEKIGKFNQARRTFASYSR